MKEEIWKDIKGYEGLYQISNQGNVRSLDRTIVDSRGRVYNVKGIILKPSFDKDKYYHVGLKNKTRRVHRLVAQAFIPNPENKPQINHKDCNKINNFVENLEWCSAKYNINESWRLGMSKAKCGEDNYLSKLTEKDIKEIVMLYKKGYNPSELAIKYNVSQSSISDIICGRTWKHMNVGNISQGQNGARAWSAKLTENQVIDIHKRYRNGENIIKLAKEYNVTNKTISSILTGVNWKYLNIKSSFGRVKGERSGMSKLKEKEVIDIKKNCLCKKNNFIIYAKKYNVRFETIEAIVRGRTWKHVVIE